MASTRAIDLSVVVVCFRERDLLLQSLAAIRMARAQVRGTTEVVVVDNSAGGELGALVATREADVRVLATAGNAGFAGGVVHGIRGSTGRWVALINDDAVIDPPTLDLMLSAGDADAGVGSVAAAIRWLRRPEELNSAGLEVDALGVASECRAATRVADLGSEREDAWGATACTALYRREMLDAIGGFDASFFAYQEDVDVAWRARAAGWRCVLEPQARASHAGSASTGEGSSLKYRLVGRNRMRLLAKNAPSRQLLRWGWAMLLYDLAYVAFVAMSDRTLAPLRGRWEGLREWRTYREAGAPTRRPTPMARGFGPLGALRQRAAYRR